jgi:hypothetical protein
MLLLVVIIVRLQELLEHLHRLHDAHVAVPVGVLTVIATNTSPVRTNNRWAAWAALSAEAEGHVRNPQLHGCLASVVQRLLRSAVLKQQPRQPQIALCGTRQGTFGAP